MAECIYAKHLTFECFSRVFSLIQPSEARGKLESGKYENSVNFKHFFDDSLQRDSPSFL